MFEDCRDVMYKYQTINTQPEYVVTEASILQRICWNVYTNKVYIIYRYPHVPLDESCRISGALCR